MHPSRIKGINRMRKIPTLFLFAALPWAASAQTTHELTNVGNTFSPNVITMDAGDNIHLVLTGNHTCTQVDQSTWNANGNTPNGGFNYSAGEHTFTLDVPGTYYYVCIPHAGLGMKGQIIVEPTTGVREEASTAQLGLFPNPAGNEVWINGLETGQIVQLIDAAGRLVLESQPTGDGLLNIAGVETGNYQVAIRDASGRMIAVKALAVVR